MSAAEATQADLDCTGCRSPVGLDHTMLFLPRGYRPMLRALRRLIGCSEPYTRNSAISKALLRRRRARGLVMEGLEQRDLFAQLTWATGPELPEARAGAAAVEGGGALLIIGGGTTVVNSWNPSSNAWSQATALDMPRISNGAAYLGNGYLVYGGQNGNAILEESLRYDPFNIDNTQDVTVMPTPSSDFAFAVDDNHMAYAIGGRSDQSNALSRVVRYDNASSSWQNVAPLPLALVGSSAVNDGNGNLLVFGGADVAGNASNEVFQYSVAGNTWSSLTSMPVAEHNGSAVLASDGRIYVLGGVSNSATLSTVQSFDVGAGTWTLETDLPQPLSHVAAASDSYGHIVVAGGYDINHVAVKQVNISQVMNAPDTAPAFTSAAPITTMVGANYVYNVRTTGNPQANYQLVNAPSGMTVDPLGTINWIPTLAQAGLNTVTVRATNQIGSADQTFSVRALTPPPTAPINLTVSSTTTNSVSLAWSPSTDGVGVAGYKVYRITHTGFHGITTVHTQLADVPTTSATITGLTAGSSYVYTVKAYNASGNISAGSNTVTVRTLSPISYTGPTTVPATARHPITFTLSASANPNTFSYTNLTPTDGMTLNPATGQVTWTPSDSDVGNNYYTFRIDHLLGSVTVEVNVSVTPNLPYSTFISGPNAVVGVPYSAQFSQIADPYNTDPVSFQLVNGPAGMTIDALTGQVNWTPTTTDLATAAVVTVAISNYAGTTNNTATISTAFASPVQHVVVSHISTTTTEVTWLPPANTSDVITSYSIIASYRVQSGRSLTTRTLSFATSGSENSVVLTGLPIGKSINISIRALDKTGHTGWAGTATLVTASQLPTVTINSQPFNYDGNAHPALAIATNSLGSVVPGTFSFTYDGLETPPALPGIYNVRATFTSNDPTYGERIATGILTILPGIPTVKIDDSIYPYDGLAHGLSATVVGIDGVSIVAGSVGFTYNGSGSMPTSPGIYAVVANFTSSDPLYGASTGTAKLTIRSVGSLVPNITLSHLSSNYDGSPHAALARAKDATGATIPGVFVLTYNGVETQPVNVGVYTVDAKFISFDPAYHDVQTTATFSIHKATPVINVGWTAYAGSAPVPVITFDGLSHDATAVANDFFGNPLPGSFSFIYSPTSPTGVGTYSVTATFNSDDPNYASSTVTQDLTIEPASPYVEIAFADPAINLGSNYYYGTYDAHTWTATATAFDLNGVPISGAILIGYYAYDTVTNDYTIALTGAPVSAGSYLVVAAFTSGNSNYADVIGYGLVQIDAALPTLIVGGTFNYDGQAHAAKVQSVGVDGVTPVSGSFTLLYNGSPTQPVNAGTYAVSATFTSNDPNYYDSSSDGSMFINKVTPIFTNLSIASAPVGSSTTTATGRIGFGSTYPSGGTVSITLNGSTVTARVSSTGSFSIALSTAALNVGSYPVNFAYTGNSTGFNAAPSASATLVLTPRAPVVTTNPTARTVTAGATANFTAAASGTPTPTVQWQLSTDNGATFANIAGANATTFSLTTTNTMNGYRYRAVFTNSGGTVSTSSATLTVQYAPVITTQPVSQTVIAGTLVRFTAAARSNPAATVQWQVSSNGGTTWSNVSGATTTTLSITATTALRGYRYRAVFTNSVGSTNSTAAVLTV